MTDKIQQARRAAFEAWSAENSGASLDRDCRGGYLSFSSMQLWAAWNAALDCVVIELPKSRLNEAPYKEACRAAIESTNLGIKVK